MEKKAVGLELKLKNRKKVFDLLYKNGRMTRQEIVNSLQLSLPTVTQDLSELIDEGFIEKSGKIGYTGGRKATAYSVVSSHKVAIGLDITRYHVYAAMVDLKGQVILFEKNKLPFRRNQEFFAQLGEIVNRMIDDSGVGKEHILGVAMAVPGVISSDGSRIEHGWANDIAGSIDISGLTLSEMASETELPCMLCRDAEAACLSEFFGSEQSNDAFYLLLSNSVAGAFYQNGKIYRGKDMRSGNIEHIRLNPMGSLCYCGRHGCVDTCCNSTRLSFLSNGELKLFFEKLEKKESAAVERWEEYRRDLSETIGIIRLMYDSEVILGGYVGRHLDPYMDEIRRSVREIDPYHEDTMYLRTGKVWKESVAAGAALQYILPFLQKI